jgi:hypothetical protein
MKENFLDQEELQRITVSLDSLRASLEEDLLLVRQLPEPQIARLLRHQSETSRDRADALLKRITELREVVNARLRTLERLRARMRQLRGGAKPH